MKTVRLREGKGFSEMKKYDLIVVGGGLTGIAASVCGARAGLSVLLCEQSGALGGAMNNCLVMPFMPYKTRMPETGKEKYLSDGFFRELRELYARHATALHEPKFAGSEQYFNQEIFKLAFDEITADSGVELLFHAKLCGAHTEGRDVKSISLATTAGIIELEADYFIDATGDGVLMAMSGCEFVLGRERDNLCQPMTACFRLSGVDVKGMWEIKDEINRKYKAAKIEGRIKNPREDVLMFNWNNGYVHFNTTRIVKLDPTDPFDVSRAEVMAREQVGEIVAFLKESFECFKDAVISSIAADIGIRESRKLVGEYVLSAEDLLACTKFEDAIALGNYDIDIHNPEGAGTSHHYFKPGEIYTVPYRSLLPREYDNMLVAGRCLSATHEAQASVRIMPICCCMGEAAGRAIALAKRDGVTTRRISIAELQSQLAL